MPGVGAKTLGYHPQAGYIVCISSDEYPVNFKGAVGIPSRFCLAADTLPQNYPSGIPTPRPFRSKTGQPSEFPVSGRVAAPPASTPPDGGVLQMLSFSVSQVHDMQGVLYQGVNPRSRNPTWLNMHTSSVAGSHWSPIVSYGPWKIRVINNGWDVK